MSMPTPSTRRATLMLICVALFWGLSFPLIKTWQNASGECPGGAQVSALTVLGLRMFLAAIVLAILQPRLVTRPTLQEHGWGALLGVMSFLGLFIQFWAADLVTPALSAFLTCLGSAWVPILAFLIFRILSPRSTLLGLMIGVVGVAILTLQQDNKEWEIGFGETLTLLSSFIFASQILFVDRIGNRINSAHLTLALFASTAVLSLSLACYLSWQGSGIANWISWTQNMLSQRDIVIALSLLVVFSTVLGFHGMNVYQPMVPAGRAAVIYLLEPVFASLISIPWGYDELSWRLVIGGGLILLGNYIVEVWSRRNGVPAIVDEESA